MSDDNTGWLPEPIEQFSLPEPLDFVVMWAVFIGVTLAPFIGFGSYLEGGTAAGAVLVTLAVPVVVIFICVWVIMAAIIGINIGSLVQ